MSKFVIIAVLASVMAGVPVASAAAQRGEELTAWERSADRRIHGECLVRRVLSARDSILLLDARSDEQTYTELRAIGSAARSAIEAGRVSGVAADFLRMRLANAAASDLVAPDDAQLGLCRTDAYVKECAPGPRSLGKTPDTGGARLIGALPVMAGFGSQFSGKRGEAKSASLASPPPRLLATNINNRDYRYDSAKVDYWRLYLYRWEDLPWEPDAQLKAPPSARASARAYVPITPILFKKQINSPAATVPMRSPEQAFRGAPPEERNARVRRTSIPIHRMFVLPLPSAPLTSIIREVSV